MPRRTTTVAGTRRPRSAASRRAHGVVRTRSSVNEAIVSTRSRRKPTARAPAALTPSAAGQPANPARGGPGARKSAGPPTRPVKGSAGNQARSASSRQRRRESKARSSARPKSAASTAKLRASPAARTRPPSPTHLARASSAWSSPPRRAVSSACRERSATRNSSSSVRSTGELPARRTPGEATAAAGTFGSARGISGRARPAARRAASGRRAVADRRP